MPPSTTIQGSDDNSTAIVPERRTELKVQEKTQAKARARAQEQERKSNGKESLSIAMPPGHLPPVHLQHGDSVLTPQESAATHRITLVLRISPRT